MQIAVVSARTGKVYGDLRPELALVKSSLLYGQHIRLLSGKIPMLYIQIGNQMRGMSALVESAADLEASGSDVAGGLIETLRRREGRVPPPFDQLMAEDGPSATTILRAMAEVWEDQVLPMVQQGSEEQHRAWLERFLETAVAAYARRQQVDELPLTNAAQELVTAIQAEVVTLDLLNAQRVYEAGTEEVVWTTMMELLDALEAVAQAPGAEFALFDARASELAEALVDGPAPTVDRAAQVGHTLLASLEAFPMASMDVVLDVRERLQPAVVRFRAALAETATDLSDVSKEEFPRALEDLRLTKVAPSVLEIEESLEDLKVRPALLRGWPASAAGVIGLGAAAAVKAPELVQVAPAVVGVSTALTNEISARAAAYRDRRRNAFFLLHEADRYLKSRAEPSA